MNPIMIKTNMGYRMSNNNKVVYPVYASLIRNNTFCPNVKRTIFNLSKNKDGEYVLATTVFFADDTKVTVKNSMNDKISVIKEKITLSDGSVKEVETASLESREIGVAYAILKRLVCVPEESGTVNGSGFANFLRKTVENAWNQTIEYAKTKGEEAIKKSSAKSVVKTEKVEKPSLRKCVQTLSELLSKLDDKLSK